VWRRELVHGVVLLDPEGSDLHDGVYVTIAGVSATARASPRPTRTQPVVKHDLAPAVGSERAALTEALREGVDHLPTELREQLERWSLDDARAVCPLRLSS